MKKDTMETVLETVVMSLLTIVMHATNLLINALNVLAKVSNQPLKELAAGPNLMNAESAQIILTSAVLAMEDTTKLEEDVVLTK